MDETFFESLFLVLMLGGVIAIVFEVIKYEQRLAGRPCICGHSSKDHVRYKDWDSNAWIDGAEYKPGQCRKCKCRSPILQ